MTDKKDILSKTLVIEPTQKLIETVVSLIEPSGADYSRTAIVFPGKRPAHFLRKLLAERIGHSFIPPRIFSFDEFIDHLHAGLSPQHGKKLDAMNAVALLYAVHQTIEGRLGGSNFLSLDAFYPIGLKLFGELEELRIANLSTEKISAALKPISYGRVSSLATYYEQFYALAMRERFATRSMRYSDVADHCDRIDLTAFSSVIITGFLGLTNSEKTLFAELRRRNNTTFVYQRGMGLQELVKDLTIDEVKEESAENPETEIALYEAQDTHGQVFALSSLVKQSQKPIDEKTVIVLPTADALFPLYHHTLPLLESEGYNIALGYPLSRTPIYGFLNNLMDLVAAQQSGRFPASAYLKFVLHPYTKNIKFDQRSDVSRILVHSFEEALARDTSRMYVTLDELESMDELFTRIPHVLPDGDDVTPEQLKSHLTTIHDRTIRSFDSFSSIADCAKKGIELLLYIYAQSTASLHPMFRRYAETMLEMFHELEISLLASHRFEKTEGYFNFLRRFVTTQEVPFPGTPLKGLQVLGLLETRNLQFDTVYVLDVNDHVLPGGIGTEMMLPQRLREDLGLETYRDREKLTAYYFGLLLQGAKNVHLFFTETGKSEKSRFVEKILWERQQREPEKKVNDFVSAVQYNVKLTNTTPQPIEKTQEVVQFLKNMSYSASALNQYLSCPLQFYYARVTRLQEKEDVETEVDNLAIGSFVHAMLKSYYEPFVGKSMSAKEIDVPRMDRLVEEQFTKTFGSEKSGTLYLLKRQVTRQLRAFLQRYQLPMLEATSVVIEDLESGIQVERGGFRFEGRLDRIERRGNEIFILDYKTGKDDSKAKVNFKKLIAEDRETWGEAISSLQLPFYLLLYSHKTSTDIKQIHAAYLFLGRNTIDDSIETEFTENPDERLENFRNVEQVIDGLVEEIVSPDVRFVPTRDLQKHCPDCPYKTLCGTQWVKGWNEHN